MTFSDTELSALRDAVCSRLSPARFAHTLGVEACVARLAPLFLSEEKRSELRAAAILHDIAKELPAEEQKQWIRAESLPLTAEDLSSPTLLHAFAAPALIRRFFPHFATEDILSAVFYHTTGRPGMTTFEKLLFLSDYIEEGRTYPSCIEVRRALFSDLENGVAPLAALDTAVLSVTEQTLRSLSARGISPNSRTLATRDFLLSRKDGENTHIKIK